jgi:hypothetical protein
MVIGMRLIARLVAGSVMLAALCSPAAPRIAAPPAATPTADPASATVRTNPEVRLRKLHLVRPDLIPYPVAYEVYC